MKNKLTRNISLKIMSVATAVLVWMIVVNVDNPIRTVSYTIQNVELLNQTYIDQKVPLPDTDHGTFRVYITAERKTLSRISASDIRAVADLQQALSFDEDPVMVPITVSCDGVSPGNIEVVPNNLAVHLEDKKTQEFVISVNSGESKPGKGYEIGSLTANPEKIKITGPTSLINIIGNVTANISVDNKTENVTKETELVIYDKNGTQLTDAQMSYLNVPKVTVTAKLWRVRSNIQIIGDYTGEPAEGYQVESVVTVPNVLSLAGSEEALGILEEEGNVIRIPAEYIDISGESSDVETKVNITQLLSDGLKLPSGASEDVWVRVNILPEGSHSYELDTNNIAVENQPEDTQVIFAMDKIELRIKETDGAEETLDPAEIEASVDLEGKTTGNYDLSVKIKLPDGYELVDPVTAEVEISEISIAENISDE